ncbi:MAG: hypothetical protein JXR10_02995 [Cyclobacteriaceae bacterium]
MTSEKKRQEYVDEKGIVGTDDDGNETTKLDFRHINKYLDLDKKTQNSFLAERLIQRNFIVSLISQFDAYVGSLIRKIFIIQPELLNGSDRNLSFSKLSEYSSIDEAKEYIIEKEIESVLRDSHYNQFKWLENKLGMTLTKDLPSFCDFIEITERRNLFVHSNGVVSSQYLSVCNKHNYQFDSVITTGQELSVDEKYFTKAYRILFEIGTKLSQVIWRKLLPDDLENADLSLNKILYRLLQRREYKLAINLSEFATSILKKHSSQEFKLVFNVNKAQAYKWDGQDEICSKMMKNMDWSAMSDKFKMSKAVLLDDFETVYMLMKKIGKDEDELPQEGYKEWPLFNKVRQESKFKEVYKDIYEEEYEFVKYDDDYLLKFGIREDQEEKNKKKLPPKKYKSNGEDSTKSKGNASKKSKSKPDK